MKTIDWTRPLQTKDGAPVTLVSDRDPLALGRRCVKVEGYEGDHIYWVYPNGNTTNSQDDDPYIVNIQKVKFLNVYEQSGNPEQPFSRLYNSLDAAADGRKRYETLQSRCVLFAKELKF